MQKFTWMIALVVGLGLAGTLQAQSALDRLEERLRGDRNPPPARDDDPEEVPPDDEAPDDEPSDEPAPADENQDGAEQDDPTGDDPAADEPGYLGAVLDARESAGRGVRVVEVLTEGPADLAGLTVGDLITSVNDQRVRQMDDFAEPMLVLRPGDQAVLQVLRDGARRTVLVTLGTRPDQDERRFEDFGPVEPEGDAPPARGGAYLGIGVDRVDEATAARLNLEELRGALVREIVRGSPADEAGLPLDSVIVGVDNRPIESDIDLERIIARASPGDELTIEFLADGEVGQVRVVLGRIGETARRAGPPLERDDPEPEEDDPGELARLRERVARLESLLEAMADQLESLERRLDRAPPE